MSILHKPCRTLALKGPAWMGRVRGSERGRRQRAEWSPRRQERRAVQRGEGAQHRSSVANIGKYQILAI